MVEATAVSTYPSNTGTASAALYARALKVFPGGNTRITYAMKPFAPYASRGAGAYVWDADGKEHLDLVNNFFSLIHGHAHPDIVRAITACAASGTAFGLPTEHEVLLAEAICRRSPVLQEIRFVGSGTEAVMTAIKAARAYTGRAKIAKVEGAYHGAYDHVEVSLDPTPQTWGAGDPSPVGYVRGTPPSVIADTVVLPFNDPERAIACIERHGSTLAAVVIDPLPSRVGLIAATSDYLKALREVTQRLGILLVFDEVISFRLHHGGAHTLFGISPDLVALAKVIGGGLPVGAVAGRRDVMAVFDWRDGKPFLPAGGTFNANPLTMTAGLAAMTLLTPAVLAELNALGDRLRAGATAVFRDLNAPWQITGLGSLFRLHPHQRPIHDYRTCYPTPVEREALSRLHRHLLEHGVLITPTGSGALSTPMREADVERFLSALRDAVIAVTAP
ncbi:aspartate aminotransferase family protein [Reyranella sp. CPCC 100927]|uniref:aspartate aminotransferase family protein n=1 Tax=Reyranella sp. CPCC 100927 TaxID=2599616 RepID=UPI0015B3BAF4|nr:aspartate aminotransferase family protein [Reyranella sp. CPCC 100927]